MGLDWVKVRLTELMGAVPFSGTLNLRVPQQLRKVLFDRRKQFPPIIPPHAESCPGYLVPIHLSAPNGQQLPAWAVLPEASLHPDILEVISPYPLRSRLSLQDGDNIRIEVS